MSDIMSIARLRVGTDGRGVRTLVGFHGCPLDCKYCINRECHAASTPRADYSPEELINVIAIDEPYFLMTGGGITFGGGEPLLKASFIHEVCRRMRKTWSCVIETSLYAPWDQIELLISDIDYWFIDIKELDPIIYMEYTGRSNDLVLSNLKKLISLVPNERICVRVPVIPEFNTKERAQEEADYIRENISSEIEIDIFEYLR